MSDPIIVKLSIMGSDDEEPKQAAFNAGVTVEDVLSKFGEELGGRKAKVNGLEADTYTSIYEDNSNVVITPKKIVQG